MAEAVNGILSGIRVLDLGRVLAAPLATQTLADLGAEVIGVERPRVGSDERQYGPNFLNDKDGNRTLESSFYLSGNRNKKSVAVDRTKEGGRRTRSQAATSAAGGRLSEYDRQSAAVL
jgi:crotonobetainyl-CoA:carnitine CoA-transferase CaiB-like acyl-CoA transferase